MILGLSAHHTYPSASNYRHGYARAEDVVLQFTESGADWAGSKMFDHHSASSGISNQILEHDGVYVFVMHLLPGS